MGKVLTSFLNGFPGAISRSLDDVVMLGVQALLRDRLLQGYRYFFERGYAGYEDRRNLENLYMQYHHLGENGVMDDLRRKFIALPTQSESEE